MKISKRLLAVLMAVVMILTIVPLGLFAFAGDEEPTPPEPRTETETIKIDSFDELKKIGTDAEYPVASTKATAEDGAEVTTNYVYELTTDIILLSKTEKLEALLKDETEQQKAGDYYKYAPTYTLAESFVDGTTYYEKQYTYSPADVTEDNFDSLKATLYVGTDPDYTLVAAEVEYDPATTYYTCSENGYAQATGVTVDNFSDGEYYTFSYGKMTYAILQEEGKVEDYISKLGLTDDECAFNPIPNFSATFDGKEFKIVGLSISGTDKTLGMFTGNDGEIKNLTLGNTKITLKTSLLNNSSNISIVGGIVGINAGVIDNCHFDGTVSIDAIDAVTSPDNKLQELYSASLNIGGVAGVSIFGTITNCDSTLTVSSNYAGGANVTAGKIVGSNNDITILDNSTYARKVTSFDDYPVLTESVKQEKLTEEAEKATYELLKYTAEDGTVIYYIRMIDCAHTGAKKTPGVVATCQHSGNIEYWTCPDCGLYFDEEPTINSKSVGLLRIYLFINKTIHDTKTTKKVEALDPTCGADGNIEYWYCSACKKYMIKATGAEDEKVVTIEGVDGKFIEVEQSATVVPATGEHKTATHYAANEPTYTTKGNKEYWQCDECEQYFLEETCETPVDYDKDIAIAEVPAPTVVPKTASKYTISSTDNTISNVKTTDRDGITVADFLANLDAPETGTYVIRDKNGEVKTDGILCTGDTIEVSVEVEPGVFQPFSKLDIAIMGDINGDGLIRAADAKIALDEAASKTKTLTGVYALAANVDGRADIKASDAKIILDYSAKVITAF